MQQTQVFFKYKQTGNWFNYGAPPWMGVAPFEWQFVAYYRHI